MSTIGIFHALHIVKHGLVSKVDPGHLVDIRNWLEKAEELGLTKMADFPSGDKWFPLDKLKHYVKLVGRLSYGVSSDQFEVLLSKVTKAGSKLSDVQVKFWFPGPTVHEEVSTAMNGVFGKYHVLRRPSIIFKFGDLYGEISHDFRPRTNRLMEQPRMKLLERPRMKLLPV